MALPNLNSNARTIKRLSSEGGKDMIFGEISGRWNRSVQDETWGCWIVLQNIVQYITLAFPHKAKSDSTTHREVKNGTEMSAKLHDA